MCVLGGVRWGRVVGRGDWGGVGGGGDVADADAKVPTAEYAET